MNVTALVEWFLENLLLAVNSSKYILQKVLKHAEFWQKHIDITFNERQKKVLKKAGTGRSTHYLFK